MDRVVPWRELCAVVEPFYSKASSGAGLSTAAPLLQARGKPGESGARNPNYAGNAFMGPSMLLFALAGLLGASL